ncbi:hypothetical protein [Caballeronia arationis]|uniref:hypothetical protein n=1 Tax=Caballeronia arationis TaxID=1777142 RepID=UPI000A8D5218|nr:hypothetical protein [Caballeronia arationis]
MQIIDAIEFTHASDKRSFEDGREVLVRQWIAGPVLAHLKRSQPMVFAVTKKPLRMQRSMRRHVRQTLSNLAKPYVTRV